MAAQEFKTKSTFHWALMEPVTLLISKPKPCYLGICAWICVSVRRFSWNIGCKSSDTYQTGSQFEGLGLSPLGGLRGWGRGQN